MKYTALVPIKSLAQAKSRLAPFLAKCERETLVLDMLSHVLSTLRSCAEIERIGVVSADSYMLALAERWGAIPLLEQQHGHNTALHEAALHERALGAEALLTISADLPLLAEDDVLQMLRLAEQYQVVLAPSREGTGTNALLVRPPLAIPYLFGVNSLERHLEAARQRHLSSALHHAPGLAFDIDTIEDVRELESAHPAWREQSKLTVS